MTGFAQSYDEVDEIPNPKSSTSDGFISNPDGILTMSTVEELNYSLAELRDSNGYEVAVVCVNSVGSNVPKDFATELFNYWKLGTTNKNNGLLILFVLDQRNISFETGYGTETVLPDVACKQIQEEYMIPFFKRGDYNGGIIQGVAEVRRRLSGKEIDIEFDDPNKMNSTDYYNSSSQTNYASILIPILAWHLIGVIIFLIALIVVRTKYDPYRKYRIIRYFNVLIWPILFPLTHIFIYFLAKRMKNRYRNTIRFSGKTGEIMHKLNEQDEDEFLTKGQISEELVKSVDYDVWITEDKADITVLEYKPFFTKYTKCPKCHYQTYYKEYDITISSPTYYSSGTGERKHSCANCKHVNVKRYTIPKLTRSSRTSGGGGGSWSGGSSGGGSWGGGSSGGGGASSSW